MRQRQLVAALKRGRFTAPLPGEFHVHRIFPGFAFSLHRRSRKAAFEIVYASSRCVPR
jgi:hypothetical protein